MTLMTRRFFPLFVLILIACSAAPAHAAIDKAGAQKLQDMFTQMLAEEAQSASLHGSKLEMDGTVTVETEDTYYAVTLPSLAVAARDGSRLAIGMVAINAQPGDRPKGWKMTVAFPTPLVLYDPAGKPEVTIDIGRQSFAGIWNEDFRNFTTLNARYENLRFSGKGKTVFNAVLPAFTVVYDLKDNGSGRWSGPMTAKAEGLDITSGDGSHVKVETIGAETQIDDYDIAAAITYREKAAALAESMKAGETSVSPEHSVALYNMITDLMGKVWDGFSVKLSMNGFSAQAATAGKPASAVTMGTAFFNLGMNGFRRNNVTLELHGGYNGFSMAAASTGTIPDHADIDISLGNIPFADIAALGRTSMEGAVRSPEMAQLMGLQAVMTLPAILKKAGSVLTLRAFSLGNPGYETSATGSLVTDPQAMGAATGEIKAKIAGIETLIAAAKAQNPPRPDMVKALTTLQLAGQQAGADGQGRTVRTYDIVLDKKGQTLLNGTDVNVLFGPKP